MCKKSKLTRTEAEWREQRQKAMKYKVIVRKLNDRVLYYKTLAENRKEKKANDSPSDCFCPR